MHFVRDDHFVFIFFYDSTVYFYPKKRSKSTTTSHRERLNEIELNKNGNIRSSFQPPRSNDQDEWLGREIIRSKHRTTKRLVIVKTGEMSVKIGEISLFSPRFRRVNKIKPYVTVVRVNSSFSPRCQSLLA